MTLDAKAILLVGGAVALPSLLDMSPLGRKAGRANDAAAATLGTVAGIPFAVPSNHSMVDAHASMQRALAGQELPLTGVARIAALWLDAYKAGAKADPINYGLWPLSGNGILDTGGTVTDVSFACASGELDGLSPLGRAVCALSNAKVSGWGSDETGANRAAILSATAALARAMDAADYLADGDRRSDRVHIHSLEELPALAVGKLAGVIGKAATAALTSPVLVGLAVGAAYLAWRHFR